MDNHPLPDARTSHLRTLSKIVRSGLSAVPVYSNTVASVSYTHLDVYKRQQCAMSDRAERTFELLRYTLGGDRPSQTTHHTLSWYLSLIHI